MNKTVYLSGWISSNATPVQIEKNKKIFFDTEKELLKKGLVVLNPARLNCGSYRNYESYMYASFNLQKQASTTMFLPGYENSYGAAMEFLNAKRLGHEIEGFSSHPLVIDSDLLNK